MTAIIRIEPDGTVTDLPGRDLLAAATDLFGVGNVGIVTCRSPLFDGYLVAAIHEWGRTEGRPLNPKGWACYGRSPLCGTVLLAHDQDDDGNRPDLDEELVARLKAETVYALVGAEVVARMRAMAQDEGLRWPA